MRLRSVSHLGVFGGLVLLSACGSAPPVTSNADSGTDSGIQRADAGVDAGTQLTDAGVVGDAGATVDAGAAVDAGTGAADAGAPDLRFESPPILVDGGTENIWCFFFKTNNTAPVSIQSWSATLSSQVVSASLFFTATEVQPAGTLSVENCGFSNRDWAFTAWQGQTQWSFPADDGTGTPVAKVVPVGQAGFIMIHVADPSVGGSSAAVRIDAKGYQPGTTVTRAEPFVAYNANLNINASGVTTATQTCATPAGAKFNWLSMLTYKLATSTSVSDGASPLFQSTHWSAPGAHQTNSPPFATFATNHATFSCEYLNNSPRVVHNGQSPTNDENCAMLAYSFPATKPSLCVNGFDVP